VNWKHHWAAPLGVSVPTITQWLSVLETTAQILIVPPFYENLGKRLIKSPKIYLADSGLACHLLGIDTAAELAESPFRCTLFEGYIARPMPAGAANCTTSATSRDWKWISWYRAAPARSHWWNARPARPSCRKWRRRCVSRRPPSRRHMQDQPWKWCSSIRHRKQAPRHRPLPRVYEP
jgi:hypothetical protein